MLLLIFLSNVFHWLFFLYIGRKKRKKYLVIKNSHYLCS